MSPTDFTSHRNRDNAVGTVARLRAEQPRNRGSIPGKGKRFVSSLKRQDGFWGPLGFYSVTTWGERKEGEADRPHEPNGQV
jgi:hypothetical protein